MQRKISKIFKLILSDRDTRNLSFFLLLNLCFAFVELFYGLLTNSLGLISDSFHMFFDCSALLLGLAASIIAKWKPSEKFTYGYVRAETLTGLANGLFLLFIALFIMKESIERTFEPPEVHHERLFVISVLGFIVNLIGIFVFQHGGQMNKHHSCSSHSHSHSSAEHQHSSHKTHNHNHDHHGHNHLHNENDSHVHEFSHFSSPTIIPTNSNNNCNPSKRSNGAVALDMNGYNSGSYETVSSHHHHTHDDHSDHHHDHYHHHHDHDHSHHGDTEPLVVDPQTFPRKSPRGQIMQSVLLHIIADTLGSVGVIISAILMNQFGWLIADPLCSMFIAILISISVYPLLRDSIFVLMQRIPVELEKELPQCLNKIQNLPGVFSMHEVHFWTLSSDTYIGCLKLEVKSEADQQNILKSAKIFLQQIGVDRVHIQIDRI